MKKEYNTSYIDICDTYNNDTTTEGNNLPDNRIEKRLNRKQRRKITKIDRKYRVLKKHKKQIKIKNRRKNKIVKQSRKKNRQKIKINIKKYIRTIRKIIHKSIGLPYNIIFEDSKENR